MREEEMKAERVWKCNCPHCEQKLDVPESLWAQVLECPVCHKEMKIPSEKEIAAEMTDTMDFNTACSFFVGEKHSYFSKKWQILSERRGKIACNAAGFFFGVLWVFYRKMYLWGFVTLVVLFGLEPLCQFFFKYSDGISNSFGRASGLLFWLNGHYLYKRHVEKKVRKILLSVPPEKLSDELKRQGGTNLWAALGIAVVLIGIWGIYFFVEKNDKTINVPADSRSSLNSVTKKDISVDSARKDRQEQKPITIDETKDLYYFLRLPPGVGSAPEKNMGYRHKAYGVLKILQVFEGGVLVVMREESERVIFIKTPKEYVDDAIFQSGLYVYTGSFSYELASGGSKTVYAFEEIEQK